MYGNDQRWAGATFVKSAIEIPQLEGSISAIAIRNFATFKEMLLRNRNSAIPQSQFFSEVHNFEPAT